MSANQGHPVAPPPLAPDEPLRLEALRGLNLVQTPLEERFERITRMARRMLGVDIAAVSLVEADYLWFKSAAGFAGDDQAREGSFCAHAILQDTVLVVEDARVDPRFAGSPIVVGYPNAVFYAGTPLRTEDGSCVGTLCVIHHEPRGFDANDRRTLLDLAAMAESEMRSACAAAVQADLLEEVTAEQRRGMIDHLTRVWNRTGVEMAARRALVDAQYGDAGVGFVLVDLDHFKRTNDTLGHAAGDAVLRIAARRMVQAARETDVVARIGGDEFLLLLAPCRDQPTALGVADRVRRRLGETPVEFGGASIAVSASLGVHFVGRGASVTFEEAVRLADAALYRSKHAGRDAVSV